MAAWPFKREANSIVEVDREVERWADRVPVLNTYATVIAFIILDLLFIGVFGNTPYGQVFTLITRVIVFVLALHVSRVKARFDVIFFGLALIGLVVGAAAVIGGKTWGTNVAIFVGMFLVLIPPFAIARRLITIIQTQGIVLEAIWAALSIYLLLGLVYASLFTAVAQLSGNAFFVQEKAPLAIDYVYFSYVTLSTIGYGDLTAAGSFGRMLAVSEGLFGQLYLVTVVALIVSNFRGSPRMRERRVAGEKGAEESPEPTEK